MSSKRAYLDDSDSDESVDFKKMKFDKNSDDSSSRLDEFCWKCHNESHGEVKCSKCPVTFHEGHIPDQNRNKPGWKCPECVSLEEQKSGSKPIGPNDNDVDQLVNLAVQRISLNHGVFKLPNKFFESSLLLKSEKITFERIMEKSERGEYSSLAAFLLDFKWLFHNCKIVHKNSVGNAKAKLAKTVKDAQDLLTKCGSEIEEIERCGDCYYARQIDLDSDPDSDWFAKDCSEPHLIVWAKFNNDPYWPAKVLQVQNSPHPLLVYFFKEQNIANIGYNNCLLYSEDDPNLVTSNTHSENLKDAIEVASAHIANLERKYFPFHYDSNQTVLEKNKMKMYLDRMLPGYRNPAKRVSYDDLVDETVQSNIEQPSVPSSTNKAKQLEPNTTRFSEELKAGLQICREMVYLYKDENERLLRERERLTQKMMEGLRREQKLEFEYTQLKVQFETLLDEYQKVVQQNQNSN